MKYYKIKLPHDGKEYVYPPGYLETIAKFNQGHVYYDDPADGVFTLLMAIPDINVLTASIENVTEITEAEANVIGDQFDPTAEKITNEAVAQRLAIKAALGQPFTTKEQSALDPNDPEPGFSKSDGFIARITAKKAILKEG